MAQPRFRWTTPKLVHLFTQLRDEIYGNPDICPLFARHGDKVGSWEKFLNRLQEGNASIWEGATYKTIKFKVKETLKAREKGDSSHLWTTEEFDIDKLLTEITQKKREKTIGKRRRSSMLQNETMKGLSPETSITSPDSPAESSISMVAAPASPSDTDESSHFLKRTKTEASFDKLLEVLSSLSKQLASSTIVPSSPALSSRTVTVLSENGKTFLSTSRFPGSFTLAELFEHVQRNCILPDAVDWQFHFDDMILSMSLTLADAVPADKVACLILSRVVKQDFSYDNM